MELSITFGLIAKLASADGAVSSSEIKLVEKLIDEVLKLDSAQKIQAIEAFNIAKKSTATFADYAQRYKNLMADKPEMLPWMLDILVKLSFADKNFSDNEIILLEQASKIFDVPLNKYEKYFSKKSFEKELTLLQCLATDTFEKVSEKYNELCQLYSPEKIMKLGLPKEFVDLAQAKIKEFTDAYEAIKIAAKITVKNKVLVLGSGFLGTQIKKDFGSSVIAVSRSGKGDLNLDLSVEDNYSKIPLDVEYIIFAVSPDSSSVDSYKKAYIDILNLSLKFAKTLASLKKFIFISSTGVYGVDDGSWVDEQSDPNPIKETSKVILESENLVRLSGFKHVILRFGGIYGSGRFRMIEMAKAGIINLAEIEYSNRIHVEDCSNLIRFSILNLEGTYIGVDGSPCDKNEVILWLREQLGLDNSSYKISANNLKGKRCCNKKILDLGFSFLYPSYQEGYQKILKDRNR